jgi:hypothetical protein
MLRIDTGGKGMRRVPIANLHPKYLMEYYGQSCPSMVKSERFRKRLGHTHIYTR